MSTFDIVLLSVCGTLVTELIALLIWWLKKGRKGFVMYNNYRAEMKRLNEERAKSGGDSNTAGKI